MPEPSTSAAFTSPPGLPPIRTGVVVPYDMALDSELHRFAGGQLDLLFTRTPLEPLTVTEEQAREISRPEAVADSVLALSAVAPEAYVYGCTSGSFIRGITGERELVHAMSTAGCAPAFTTSGGLLGLTRALGASSIAMATPYDDAITAQCAAFFAEAGIHLMSNANLGLDGRIWEVSYAETYELVRRADSDRADIVIISCTNLPTFDILDALEEDLGKPVISANQATIWTVLHHLGMPYDGPGQAVAGLSRSSRHAAERTAEDRAAEDQAAAESLSEPA